MKTYLYSLVLVLFSTVSLTAQNNSINYKAIIKDNLGNVVANETITIQLSILQGVTQTNVYQETHTPTTDANGLVILNIGEGTVDSGDFSSIDWASAEHFLNVQIDTGSGLVDLGTTRFMTVPYALNAETANNVNGLNTITEDSKTGWRLKDRNPNNYGNIGINAVDLSISNATSSTYGATGLNSTAMGNRTEASGDSSLATGFSTIASGNNSTALGRSTTASGIYSTAMGEGTIAESVQSTALGKYNVGGGDPQSVVGTDPLLEVGNGTSNSNRSNALTILKNGTIVAPSLDISEITDDKTLITKEYADLNLGSSGLEALDEGNGTGWRLKGSDPNNYGNIGAFAIDLSFNNLSSTTKGATGFNSFTIGFGTEASENNSTAMGRETVASGSGATAMGFRTEASGSNSTAMGNRSVASGSNSRAMGSSTEASGSNSTAMGSSTGASGTSSTAMGTSTEASGNYATAMGVSTTASGFNSTAMGFVTTAEAFISLAIGRYNIGGGDPFNWVETDPLFEIGNGISNSNRSNALTLFKNGTITAPSFDLSEITDDKALITKEYADLNLGSSGLEALDEGNGNGWRLNGVDAANYGNVGNNAVDLSHSTVASSTQGATGAYSFATGRNNTASALYATAIGNQNNATNIAAVAMGSSANASGDYSISLGRETTASGGSSVALGSATTATNIGSIAMGSATEATGRSATAAGRFTRAQAFSSAALGRYNIGNGNANSWIESDPLFEIGNGTDDTNRSNALTVLKNGKVDIPGDLTINNTTTIGSSGTAISEVIKITGVGDAGGTTIIDYPTGYNWENTHVVSCKVKSNTGGAQGLNWYTTAGNYTSGDTNSVYVNLENSFANTNLNKIRIKISDSQYIGTEYILILMKID
ncbi:hypothetical protein J4050_02110 [Winogradskyella sp. DF17]|uniref:Trimeric autotransporter adhesin YadA-like head domain-containing protein n=1 Tax=Winogradskyella pelagia TaxID=2819984 RepID=A0ABS3SYF8_9FLAO|nr:hypothetical protein [Winogradskyella sp. DF17]MBO3115521.1 hypothetical protein [Winogradskyella sp. DF17]